MLFPTMSQIDKVSMPNGPKAQMPTIKRAPQKTMRKTVRCSCDADDMNENQFSQTVHGCNKDKLILRTKLDCEPSRAATGKGGALDVTRPLSRRHCPDIAMDDFGRDVRTLASTVPQFQHIGESPKVKTIIPGCSQCCNRNHHGFVVHEVDCKADGKAYDLRTGEPKHYSDHVNIVD